MPQEPTMDTFIAILPPRQPEGIQGWRVTPAHQLYRLGAHLLRAEGVPPPRGGLMVLGDRGFDGLGSAAALGQEVLRECQARGFSGAVLDFEGILPPLEGLCARLDGALPAQNMTLYVPERYAPRAPHARVLVSSALSGGSLRQRLEEALDRFGPERVVLALERSAEDFSLPSPTGSGRPLSREELDELMARMNPAVFFSSELCARYFTYMSRQSGAHFVLFDDGDTLRRKVETARSLSIHTFLAPWQELAPHAEAMGIPRAVRPARTPPGRGGGGPGMRRPYR